MWSSECHVLRRCWEGVSWTWLPIVMLNGAAWFPMLRTCVSQPVFTQKSVFFRHAWVHRQSQLREYKWRSKGMWCLRPGEHRTRAKEPPPSQWGYTHQGHIWSRLLIQLPSATNNQDLNLEFKFWNFSKSVFVELLSYMGFNNWELHLRQLNQERSSGYRSSCLDNLVGVTESFSLVGIFYLKPFMASSGLVRMESTSVA